ncbi:TIR domain-containing protein [Nitrospira lenta]|uniref:Cyclic nucleotide-binding domain-containing protein n=1 Tax=Nitrospira lenta TaxID=1436998 RepID=A0A330L807_9BACT|nr:TIR domain-containing protein [Nitrospira lenta]SPP66001.1 conserved hypothetical protein [Nitrospira lenta]
MARPAKRSPSEKWPKFSGSAGKRRLLESLRAQPLISGDSKLAIKAAAAGEIQRHSTGDVLLKQGDQDNDILLILSGQVSITVNGRTLAVRAAGTHVGEMALVDPLMKRSATVRATEDTVTLKLSEQKFSSIAERHPALWRRVAAEVARRLRERSKFLREPHAQPVVFIGSSSEALTCAEEVLRQLSRHPLIPRLWTQGVFEASKTAIESLVALANEADFAVLPLTADDVTISRGKRKPSPRDNIVFEIGLLMGALGRERVYILKPKKLDIRVPSDLLGLTMIEYSKGGPTPLSKRLKKPCNTIWQAVQAAGPR